MKFVDSSRTETNFSDGLVPMKVSLSLPKYTMRAPNMSEVRPNTISSPMLNFLKYFVFAFATPSCRPIALANCFASKIWLSNIPWILYLAVRQAEPLIVLNWSATTSFEASYARNDDVNKTKIVPENTVVENVEKAKEDAVENVEKTKEENVKEDTVVNATGTDENV